MLRQQHVHATYPQIAQVAARNTLREVVRTGAATLITACPQCKGAFASAGDDPVRVLDLAEIVAARL